MRQCPICGSPIVRQRRSYGLESVTDFNRRKGCGKVECANELKRIATLGHKYVLSYEYKAHPVIDRFLRLPA